MPEASQIALFGGTFDPVHLGHIAMAKEATEAFQLDQVRFIPCHLSPHKLDQPPTAGDARLRMLELATANLPWAVIDDLEIQNPGPSFSWQTAETMRSRFPTARLYWIMGFDQWQALPGWAHPERLAACVEFIVFTRGQSPAARDGYRMHAMPASHPASATAIRKEIASGNAKPPWLDPAVADWIAQHRLYRAP